MGCVSVKIGFPNEDVLLFGGGHPLYTRGLDGYGAYVVENSRWLAELIEIGRTHEDFDPRSWENMRHFLLAFHDHCVDAIARDIEARPVEMSLQALLTETIEKLLD
jgi:hypothetical protein